MLQDDINVAILQEVEAQDTEGDRRRSRTVKVWCEDPLDEDKKEIARDWMNGRGKKWIKEARAWCSKCITDCPCSTDDCPIRKRINDEKVDPRTTGR